MGSVSATCLTILAALLTLVCIRRSCLHRRRTFTYQSASVSPLSPPTRAHTTCTPECVCVYACACVFVLQPWECTQQCSRAQNVIVFIFLELNSIHKSIYVSGEYSWFRISVLSVFHRGQFRILLLLTGGAVSLGSVVMTRGGVGGTPGLHGGLRPGRPSWTQEPASICTHLWLMPSALLWPPANRPLLYCEFLVPASVSASARACSRRLQSPKVLPVPCGYVLWPSPLSQPLLQLSLLL